MAQKRYNEFVQGKHVTLDPFKTREYWGELREQLGNRVTTEIVRDADHALFPDQPDRVADVVVAWCQRLMIHETGKSENERLNLLVRRTRSNAKETQILFTNNGWVIALTRPVPQRTCASSRNPSDELKRWQRGSATRHT